MNNNIEIFHALTEQLRAQTSNATMHDGCHDDLHLSRVWNNVEAIHSQEGGDLTILAASVILHDCVSVEKNSPLRGQASKLSAVRAGRLLREVGWQETKVRAVEIAIESHSFSANIEPATLEACILQDADRLDAIGAIGIARCFYTAGRLGTTLYNVLDPRGEKRSFDDGSFALDHFPLKLLALSTGFRTATGGRIAYLRHSQVKIFYEQFLDEIGHL